MPSYIAKIEIALINVRWQEELTSMPFGHVIYFQLDPKQLIDLSILKNLGFIRSSSKSVRLLSKGSIKSSINIKVNSN